MKASRFTPFAILLCISVFSPRLRAQELSVNGGTSTDQDVKLESYSWTIEYRQGIYGPIESSMEWINEGHFKGHHRDGLAIKAWYDLSPKGAPFGFSVAAGAYYYFDTEPSPTGDSLDVHGFAPVISAALKWYPSSSKNYFIQFTGTEIFPRSDIHTLQLTIGPGYYLGSGSNPDRPNLPDLAWSIHKLKQIQKEGLRNEIDLYSGPTRINTFFRTGSIASALEYRHRFLRVFEYSITYLYEGAPKTVRRSGIATQIWLSSIFPLCDHFTVSIALGMGPYFNIDQKHQTPTRNYKNQPAISGLLAPSIAVTFKHHTILRVTWERVITDYNRDADVWLFGIGYRWK